MLFVRDFLTDQRVSRAPAAPASPAVSVILPTWRRFEGGSLRRAVESVLSQSFTDLELIVVDDGSTDGSREYLLATQAADPRLVYVRHDLNSGLPALRVNEGTELARGRYLAFQFDDDEWLEGALEALAERAERCPEPSVVFGSAVCQYPNGKTEVLPAVEVNLLTLSYANRIANNSVLFPRELADRHGLYDPHVGMRRLCDWDLWMRLVQHVPFVSAERDVSRVRVANDPSSIGVSVPIDFPLCRYLQAIPRDHLLLPSRWREYEVDAVRVGEVETVKGFRQRLESDHVLPFHRRLGHAFPHLAPPPPSASPVRSLLYTMDAFYGSIDLCLGHYDPLANRRGTWKAHYQPLAQIGPNWGRDVDLVLIIRSVTAPGPRVVREAIEARIPVAFYLDDDFLNLHEYGPPFDFIAPGKPAREHLIEQIENADAVWTTSPSIAESLLPHTPRVVPHNGSVPESWLPAELRPRASGDPGRPIRIGYVGNAYRIDEFRHLWEALLRISREFGDRLVFDFWGLDVGDLPPLDSPVEQRPYTQSYLQFMDHLREARFDFLLTPLLDHPRPRLAKAPSKYYQTAVAGAVGIFSDVPPYAVLPHGLTCLKAANDPDSWYNALREAVTMPAERFDRMRRAMVEHVRLVFTETAQIDLHEAALRATEFHSRTRGLRGEDGRPRVLYLPPGQAAAEIAREYGVQAVEPRRSPADRQTFQSLLDRWAPALVHAPEPAPTLRELCAERGIPLVSSCPATLPREILEQKLRRVLEAAAGEGTEAKILEARAEYRLARAEHGPQRGANELFTLYNRAFIEGAEGVSAPAAANPPLPPAPPEPPPSRRDRVRGGLQKAGLYRPLSRLYWSRRRKRVLVTYDNYITSVYLYWEHALPRLEDATGRQWLLRPADQVSLEDLYSFHAVISVRGLSKQSLEILRTAKRFGCRTVYDTDDNLLLIGQAFSDPENPWRRIFGASRPEMEAMLGLVDTVKVYGEPAVPFFRRYNPNVVAIRPYQILDREEPRPFEDRRPVTVGFLGSYFKDEEFGPVVQAIRRLLEEGGPVNFEFFGFLPQVLKDRPEISHVPWRSSYAEYRQTLAALGWDIGLAPLRDLEFHRGKNNAKYREYAAASIAGIYSGAEIYRTTVRHRETGLVVPHGSAEAWYEAILELAADADLRRAIQRNAFADVKANYRIEDYVARVAALLDDRAEPRPAGSG